MLSDGQLLTVLASSAEATTTTSFAMNYEDGIDLFERWDAWAAQMRKFAPREMAGTFQSSNGSWAFVSYCTRSLLLFQTCPESDNASFVSSSVLSQRNTLGGNVQ